MFIFGSTYFPELTLKIVFNAVFLAALFAEAWVLLYSELTGSKASGKKQNGDKGSMVIIILGFWASILLDPICARALPFLLPLFFAWVGIVLTAAGIWLRLYSVWTLRKFFTLNVQVRSGQEIVKSGPYRHLRHPAYAGSMLTVLGIAICFRSPFSIALAILILLPVYGYRIRVEETMLEVNFGSAYRDYEKQTWRVIPFLW